jgi:hypothetical protein
MLQLVALEQNTETEINGKNGIDL